VLEKIMTSVKWYAKRGTDQTQVLWMHNNNKHGLPIARHSDNSCLPVSLADNRIKRQSCGMCPKTGLQFLHFKHVHNNKIYPEEKFLEQQNKMEQKISVKQKEKSMR